MTHLERFEKASAALKAAGIEGCAIMLIIASPDDEGFSVASNLPQEGKIRLLKDALHRYEHGDMAREAPRNIQ